MNIDIKKSDLLKKTLVFLKITACVCSPLHSFKTIVLEWEISEEAWLCCERHWHSTKCKSHAYHRTESAWQAVDQFCKVLPKRYYTSSTPCSSTGLWGTHHLSDVWHEQDKTWGSGQMWLWLSCTLECLNSNTQSKNPFEEMQGVSKSLSKWQC